jgi:hypothetical protein
MQASGGRGARLHLRGAGAARSSVLAAPCKQCRITRCGAAPARLMMHAGGPMPATNPRLSVTVSPPVAAVLRELSTLTGNSQSAVVAELLEEAIPVFSRMVRILRAAEQAKLAVKEELVSGMEAAQTRLEGQLGLALGEFEAIEGRLLETVEKVGRRRAGPAGRAASGRSGAPLPPISNRGVTPQKPGKKAAPRAKRKGVGHA